MEVIDILYASDLNKQSSQEKANDVSLDILELPEDVENFAEESELRTTFGNYEMLLYVSMYLLLFILEILSCTMNSNCIVIYRFPDISP